MVMQRVKAPLNLEVSGNAAPNLKSGILQNMYAVGAQDQVTLRQRYGMSEIASFDTRIAGVLLRNGFLYILAENKIKVLTTSGGLVAQYNYIHSPEDRFIFLYNNVQSAGLSGSGSYFILEDSGKLTLPSFPEGWASDYFTYINGYFVFNNTAANLDQQFFFSGILDGASFNGLDFASAIEKYDKITAVYGAQNGLWVFGQNSIEVFQNSGDPDDPFQQISGASTTSIGCISPYSIVEAADSLFFVGFDSNVYKSEGYNTKPISNNYVTETIAAYSNKKAIQGLIWRERGLTFYVITLPGVRTFAYCVNTGLWSEFKRYGAPDFCVDFCVSETDVMFCVVKNKIFKVDAKKFDDGDVPIEREFCSVEFEAPGFKNYITHYVEIDCSTGLKPLAQTQPALLDFSYSDDSGLTWKGERFINLGETGDYRKTTIARRCGVSNRRIYRFGYAQNSELSVNKIFLGVDIADGD